MIFVLVLVFFLTFLSPMMQTSSLLYQGLFDILKMIVESLKLLLGSFPKTLSVFSKLETFIVEVFIEKPVFSSENA